MEEALSGRMGRIVGAIALPEARLDRVLAQVRPADEAKGGQQRRIIAEQRPRRQGARVPDGLLQQDEYRRRKRFQNQSQGGTFLVIRTNSAGFTLGLVWKSS